MTANQIKAAEHFERKRSNLANEDIQRSNLTESVRHNLQTEELGRGQLSETIRSNLAHERETSRHNVAVENENYRSNVARETENRRSNLAKESETRRSNLESEAQGRSKLELTAQEVGIKNETLKNEKYKTKHQVITNYIKAGTGGVNDLVSAGTKLAGAIASKGVSTALTK